MAAETGAGRSALIIALLVLRRATANFVEDRATQMAAGISYFALFSIFPFVLLAFAIFGIVLRDEGLQQDVIAEIIDALPIEDESIVSAVTNLADQGTTIGVFALLGTLWAASALSAALRSALNVTFEVGDKRALVRGKLLDLTVLPALGLLFLASLVLSTVWRVAQAEVSDRGIFEELTPLWELGAIGIPGLISFVGFLFLYWFLPNRPLQFRYLWPGALIAAIGFEAAKFGFTIYLANFGNYDVVYGSLGGVITLLVWVYLSANIMLFGAEVAAEVPHVLHGEERHGIAGALDVDWRRSLPVAVARPDLRPRRRRHAGRARRPRLARPRGRTALER